MYSLGALSIRIGRSVALVACLCCSTASAGVVQDRVFANDFEPLPPPTNPEAVAPPLDQTIPSNLCDASQFLYAGGAPVQYGADASVFDCEHIAVLRGQVMNRDGSPLSGVRISAKNNSRFGFTLSRDDGAFDLVVNGGGSLTLNYDKAGLLPAQRQVQVPWQDYVLVDDVVLIELDPNVTVFDLTSGAMGVAQGSVIADADGTRQATLMCPVGTTAELVFPDGTTEPIDTLSIRATEYTVGENGPEAMPGVLPPTSGYTYAVELSADEALAAGATDIEFSQPLPFYLENFLDFPVGGIVPAGYYDSILSSWIPSENGQVVKLVGETGPLAELDIDGDDVADSSSALAQLGITDEERENLASLYDPGQELWRVPVQHFTPWDCNWPVGPPDDATAPNQGPAENPNPSCGGGRTCQNCNQSGSIIECQPQVMGESVAVAGTPFSLNYRSDRVPGRADNRSTVIPLSGETVPASLKAIQARVSVLGRQFVFDRPAEANQELNFTWDGRDAFGRDHLGPATLRATIGYAYDATYRSPAQVGASFSRFGTEALSGSRARQEIVISQVMEIPLSAPDFSQFAGWSMDVHHVYDPASGVLYLGDGRSRSASATGTAVSTVTGGGSIYGTLMNEFSAPNGEIPARDFTPESRRERSSIAVDNQGRLYMPGGTEPAIYDALQLVRLDPDGFVRLIAGTGEPPPRFNQGTDITHPPEPDGIPALEARLHLSHVAVGPDQTVYIDERNTSVDIGIPRGYCRIRHIDGNGLIQTIAGTTCARQPDDVLQFVEGPAIEAQLRPLRSLLVGPDRTIYFADDGFRIYAITPAGTLIHLAGTGDTESSGDGGLATQAGGQFTAMRLNPDGDLLVADSGSGCRVRKIDTSGVIETIVGPAAPDRFACGYAEGDASGSVINSVDDIALMPNGDLLLAERDNHRISIVTPDGILSTLAGSVSGFSGDVGLAAAATFSRPRALATMPDGTIFVFDVGNRRIRKISSAFPGLGTDEFVLASESGAALYRFDGNGRHASTMNALTGEMQLQFEYGQGGWLNSIRDGDGNVTSIVRDTNGVPTAIEAPFGQVTTVTVGSNGYIARISDPLDDAWTFEYQSDGLMLNSLDPRGHLSEYDYDGLGRLVEARNQGATVLDTQDDEIQSYARDDIDERRFEVTRTTAEGHETRFETVRQSAGERRYNNSFSDGTTASVVVGRDGTQTRTAANGSIVVEALGPDPRWGMQSPLEEVTTVTTPGGITSSATILREVELADENDLQSLVTQTDTVAVDGREYVTVYDAATRTFSNTTPEGRQGSLTTDGQGRATRLQSGDLAPVYFDYDSFGRLISSTVGEGDDARTTTYTYNSAGFVDSITDPLGRTQTFTHDAVGRTLTQTFANGETVGFGYDANGNYAQITPPGRDAYDFTYTPTNRHADIVVPDSGDGLNTVSLDYNADGRLTDVLRADGRMLQFGYDAAQRIDSLTVDRGTIDYQYDGTTGQLVQVDMPEGLSLNFAYDGFVPMSETLSGTLTGTVARTYEQFRATGLSVNDATIAFSYDNDSRLTGAGDLMVTRSAVNGLVTDTALGNITTQMAYNAFAEPVQQTAVLNGADTLYDVAYTRNKLGQVTEKVETVAGLATTTSYTYDTVNRLQTVTEGGIVVGDYGYDANGNRTNDGTINATYDVQDRLLTYGSETYTYTPDGELLTRSGPGGTTTYGYDEMGNLLSVALPGGTEISYLIDGQNRRAGKQVNGTLVEGYLYQDDLNIVAVLDDNSVVTHRFVYATQDHVPDYLIKDGNTYRYVTDHIGSVRLVVDVSDGSIAQRIDYGPFGEVISDSNPGFQPFAFAGGLYDPDTGLTRFGARDYDAAIGRWTARDPLSFAGNSANLYAYAFNDPVNLIDPTGQIVPILLGAWALIELGLSLADIIAAIDVLNDPCRSLTDKLVAVGLAALGILGPGGGVGGLFNGLRRLDKARKLGAPSKADDLLTNSPILDRARREGSSQQRNLSNQILNTGGSKGGATRPTANLNR